MTKVNAQQILNLVITFCNDNEGNTINQWLRSSLIGATQNLLNQILENQEKIKEQEYFGVTGEAITRMMIAETKAILNWAEKHDPNCPSIVFIDGPIVDPPQLVRKEYVNYRCRALQKCLEKNAIVIFSFAMVLLL